MGHPGGYQSDRKPVLRLGRVLFNGNDVITTDCTLVGGDSGGPLFDMQGKVIGINSRIASELRANMHVPVNAFQGYVGTPDESRGMGALSGAEAVAGCGWRRRHNRGETRQSQSRFPADDAGLQPGDIVLKFDGITITDFASLAAEVQKLQPGARVKIEVKRGDETKTLDLRIGRKD